jgi:hypothetical protein
MRIRVKLHGVLGERGGGDVGNRALYFAGGGETTAGDVLDILAEKWGAPFLDLIAASDQRLPRHVRMFADGEPLRTRGQRLVSPNGSATSVTVVLLTPMMGG